MTLTSPAIIVADDGRNLLARIRESASSLTFPPHGTVRCDGPPLFRTRAARDLACLLDVNSDVEAWTCLPMALAHDAGVHVPDFCVTRRTGAVLVDAVPIVGKAPPPWVPHAARDIGCGYEAHAETNLRDSFRLDNARDLLRYANHHVSLGDRVRLLTLLEEQGPMPLAACVQVIRDGRDPIGVIAAMALRRFVEMDLDEARIGPETRVSRCHD